MKSELLLTICIPTYNREKVLAVTLKDLTDKIAKLPVEIVVCDNGSTDNTGSLVKSYLLTHKVSYYKQPSNRGFDFNLFTAIERARGKYCWLAGDALLIDPERLTSIVNYLGANSPMGYIMNISSRVKQLNDSLYRDANHLLRDLGWHCTQMPAIIIQKELGPTVCNTRYLNTNFIHFGILFESLGKLPEIEVYWDHLDPVRKLPENLKQSSWYPQRAWQVFMKDWCELVFSLPPSYTLENKLTCIQQHNRQTGIFSLKSVFLQKIAGAYSHKIYKQHKSYIRYANASPLYRVAVWMIALLPDSLCKKIYKLYTKH